MIVLKSMPNGFTQKWSARSGSRAVMWPATPSSKPNRPKRRNAAARRCLRCRRSSSTVVQPENGKGWVVGSAVTVTASTLPRRHAGPAGRRSGGPSGCLPGPVVGQPGDEQGEAGGGDHAGQAARHDGERDADSPPTTPASTSPSTGPPAYTAISTPLTRPRSSSGVTSAAIGRAEDARDHVGRRRPRPAEEDQDDGRLGQPGDGDRPRPTPPPPTSTARPCRADRGPSSRCTSEARNAPAATDESSRP